MEEVIEKIIELEEKAREIVRDAEKARAGLEEELDSEVKRLHSEISARVDEKNNALLEYEDGEANKRIDIINAETERVKASLEEKFNQNKDKWVEDIFKSVVGERN